MSDVNADCPNCGYELQTIHDQAAEMTRLRAKVDAADKLAKVVAEIGGPAIITARKIADYEFLASEWQMLACKRVNMARTALSAYEGEKG